MLRLFVTTIPLTRNNRDVNTGLVHTNGTVHPGVMVGRLGRLRAVAVSECLSGVRIQKRLLRIHHTTGQGRSEHTRCQSGRHPHRSSPGRPPSSGRPRSQGCSPRACPWRVFQHTAPALQCDCPSSRSPKTNTAPRSEHEAASSVGLLQWLLPDLNRGHRHFQEHAVPCKPALTGQNAVAMYPIVALFPCAHAISHGIVLPRESIRGSLEWSPGVWVLVTPGGGDDTTPRVRTGWW